MKKRSVKSDAEFEEARLGIKELESLKQIERQYLRNFHQSYVTYVMVWLLKSWPGYGFCLTLHTPYTISSFKSHRKIAALLLLPLSFVAFD